MARINDPKNIASYISCLSTLETKTANLYQILSDKAEMPMVKALFRSIAQDSSKHSTLLKGISDSLATVRENPKECAKKLGIVWQTVESFRVELEKRKVGNRKFLQLIDKLAVLESTMGEEYYVLVQMKTLQLLGKEIEQSYHIDLKHLKKIFESIIRDEEHHMELLVTVREHIAENAEKTRDARPAVKYQNPDAWIRTLPPNS